MARSAEDPLVAKAFDRKKHDELERAIEKLSSDEAAFFLHKLEHAYKKRKLQLTGYLVAMVAWLVSMVAALIYFGSHTGFVYWVFVVPFGIVGVILYAVGKWSERVGNTPYTPRPVAETGSPPVAPPADPTGKP